MNDLAADRIDAYLDRLDAAVDEHFEYVDHKAMIARCHVILDAADVPDLDAYLSARTVYVMRRWLCAEKALHAARADNETIRKEYDEVTR